MMRKGMVVVGALLVLFFVPFTFYALALCNPAFLNPEDRASSPGLVALLAIFGALGLITLIKGTDENESVGRRTFAVVLKGEPTDFQQWLEAAKAYGLYVIFSKSSRTGKLIVKEESW